MFSAEELIATDVSVDQPKVGAFYRMAVPMLWLVAAMVSWKHPGDEYLLFTLVCGLPGAWITLLFGKLNPNEAAPVLFGAGMLTMAAVGWAMDSLRVWRGIWAGLYTFGACALVLCMLSSYPSYQAALAKNGAVAAYLSAAANMSLYVTSTVSIAVAIAGRLLPLAWRRLSHPV